MAYVLSGLAVAMLGGGCGGPATPQQMAQIYSRTQSRWWVASSPADMPWQIWQFQKVMDHGFEHVGSLEYLAIEYEEAERCGLSHEQLRAGDREMKTNPAFRKQVQDELWRLEPFLASGG
jgi:hypothetical protein